MAVELDIWISFSYPVLEAILNVTVWKFSHFVNI